MISGSGLFASEEMAEVEDTFDVFLRGEAPADCWLLLRAAGIPAGVAYYAPERMTRGTWNLYLLAVDAGHHRCGFGEALVRWVEEDLRKRQARVLLIETSGLPEFSGQRAFYTRLGYLLEARIREFYDAGDDKVVFWKRLA